MSSNNLIHLQFSNIRIAWIFLVLAASEGSVSFRNRFKYHLFNLFPRGIHCFVSFSCALWQSGFYSLIYYISSNPTMLSQYLVPFQGHCKAFHHTYHTTFLLHDTSPPFPKLVQYFSLFQYTAAAWINLWKIHNLLGAHAFSEDFSMLHSFVNISMALGIIKKHITIICLI